MLPIPFAFVQVEIAEFRHVVGLQVQAKFAIDDILSVGLPPIDISDAQWAEEFSLCEIQCILPS